MRFRKDLSFQTDMSKRFRDWSFLVYPDSIISGEDEEGIDIDTVTYDDSDMMYEDSIYVSDWREAISMIRAKWICSPLHDKDQNPDGNQKKPHYHCIIMFSSVKNYRQICDMLVPLGVPAFTIEPCKAIVGSVRYMIHADHPSKYQYDPDEVIGYNGADPSEWLRCSSGDELFKVREMQRYIRDNEIRSFMEFADYCEENSTRDWYYYLTGKYRGFLKDYIYSLDKALQKLESGCN